MGYDYNYARRRRRQQQQAENRTPAPISRAGLLNLLLGLALGIGLGLLIPWGLFPTPYADQTPDTLRTDFETDYMILIAHSYQVDNNLIQARRRLETLNLEDAASEILVRTEALVAINAREADIRAMARLALALGVSSPTTQPYLP